MKIARARNECFGGDEGKFDFKLKFRILRYAILRIRIMRRWLRRVRRKIHLAPSRQRGGIDEMPRVQKAGAENSFDVQFTGEVKTTFHFRCKKVRLHRFETREQRGIREAINP